MKNETCSDADNSNNFIHYKEDEFEPFIGEILNEIDNKFANKISISLLNRIKLYIDTFIFQHNFEVNLKKEEDEEGFYFEAIKLKEKHPKIQEESNLQVKLLITKLKDKFPFYNNILSEIEFDFQKILEEKLSLKNKKTLSLFNLQEQVESNPIYTLLNKNGRPSSKALDALIIELRTLEIEHFNKNPYITLYKPVFLSISKHHPTAIDFNDFNSWDKLRSRIKYIEEKKDPNFFTLDL